MDRRGQPMCHSTVTVTTKDELVLSSARRISVSRPTDAPEVEADRTAARVIDGLPASGSAIGHLDMSVPRSAAAAEDESVPESDVRPTGAGSPLPAPQRATMERAFGHDFGAVRLHDGAQPDRAARGVNARAYTLGNDIVFRRGALDPTSKPGLSLVAHELTHVVQQGKGGTSRKAARHLQRSPDPTAKLFSNDEIQAMSDLDLLDVIKKAEHARDTAVGSSQATQWAIDNLPYLLEERVRRSARNGFKSVAPATPTASGNDSSSLRSTWTEGAEVGSLGIVQVDAGTALRQHADANAAVVSHLALNRTMGVDRKVTGGWYFVILDNGSHGYVAAADVNIKMPDPGARLYRVEEGMSAQKIVKKFFRNFVWGKDERFYVNVLAFVNWQADRPGITKPSLDAGWETTQTKAGLQIWIPSEEFADSMRGRVNSGSFTYEVYSTLKGVVTTMAEWTIGSAGFVVGLLHGALESLWDLLVGLVELVGMAWKILVSIITGEFFNDLKGLWTSLSSIKVSDIIDAAADWLDKKWNADSIWSRWHFRGWLIGYIIMEILMLFFTDGLLTAVKWVGKSAKIAKLIEKIPLLAKVAERGKELKNLKTLTGLKDGLMASETFAAAAKWANRVLRIPAEILTDLTHDALKTLKKLPEWAIERFSELSAAAMRLVLRCTSPCKVVLADIVKYLADPATKALRAGAKVLTTVDEVVAVLPKGLNVTKIKAYLQEYPALMTLIREAGLTGPDLAKIEAFLTVADARNLETAYKTFTRYLTFTAAARTEGDVGKLNKIAKALVEVDMRQGAALKGPLFEAFARVHLPEFAGKSFKRVRFKASGSLELATETRTSDFFLEASGELWDFKHAQKVDLAQAADYQKISNRVADGLPRVQTVNYLFPSKAFAEANTVLSTRFGFLIHYVDDAGKLARLL